MLVTSFVFNTVTLLSFLPLFCILVGHGLHATCRFSDIHRVRRRLAHKEDRVDLQGQGFDIIVDGDEVYIAGFYTQCNCRCARSTRIAGSDSLFEDVVFEGCEAE